MFLRRYTRTKDGKTHTYYALVESVRTEAGPRQHVVAYLGELNHDQERRWQRTVVFHNRQGEDRQLRLFPDAEPVPLPDDPGVVQIRLDSVGWTNPRRFGDVWLGLWLWKFLHLDEIVDRHVPQGRETVRPADIVAIEVINRLCGPCSEFALAEHWYQSTALEDLLGVPDSAVTKDRLYRTLDPLIKAQESIENDLKDQFGNLFQLDYDLLLYDLTSTYFEGQAEENDLARLGYSRDHRSDCKQIVLALIVTREGFPLAHLTLAGNTQDLQTVETIVKTIEARFGKSQRVWVMDRGMISVEAVKFLSRSGRRYLLATRRSELAWFEKELRRRLAAARRPCGCRGETVETKGRALSPGPQPAAASEGACHPPPPATSPGAGPGQAPETDRRRSPEESGQDPRESGSAQGPLPQGSPVRDHHRGEDQSGELSWTWDRQKFRAALARDGAYLLRSNQDGWSAQEFWETYIQLTVVEHAFRVLKSELLLRPVWHHFGGRTQAHVMICVLAYALWKTLDHLAKRAGLMTQIHKPDPHRARPSRSRDR